MQKKRGIAQYRNGFALQLASSRLHEPYSWRNPKVVFVNSMSDLFHDDIPTEYIQQVFKVMNELPMHTFQILTKRIERVRKLVGILQWTENIWMGVSVENKLTKHRINVLRNIPAIVRFVSFEPLLEDLGKLSLQNIHWVIVGGESGGKARTIKKEWIQNIQEACRQQSAMFYFKQWGKREFNPDSNDPSLKKSHIYHSRDGSFLNGELYRTIPLRNFSTNAAR